PALAVEPYALGAWLALGGSDHGPEDVAACLRASAFQRREMLAGLMDIRGEVLPDGTLRVAVPHFADLAHELVVSLGHTCVLDSSVLTFTTDEPVFHVDEKHLLHKENLPGTTPVRSIVDVRPVPSVPVRCVEVDNAAHLYLAGRAMIPTHNSTLGLDWARS